MDDFPLTTVVGSFPLANAPGNMARAFRGQIEAGITHPCYPQLVPMTAQFLEPLAEVTGALDKRPGGFLLKEDFALPPAPVALEYGQFVVDFLAAHPDLESRVRGTKACLTGPFTLSGDVLLEEEGLGKGVTKKIFPEPRAIMQEWLVDKFARVMQAAGKAYSDMGFQIVSMDEPTLSLMVGARTYIFHPRDVIIEKLDLALSGIAALPSVHVCGRLSPNLRDVLLESRAKILDHEFVDHEKNWSVYTRTQLEQHDKFLAVGVVSSKEVYDPGKPTPAAYVEPVELVEKLMRKAIGLYGAERLIFKPDCGLGGLRGSFPDEEFALAVAMGKLRNITAALERVKR